MTKDPAHTPSDRSRRSRRVDSARRRSAKPSERRSTNAARRGRAGSASNVETRSKGQRRSESRPGPKKRPSVRNSRTVEKKEAAYDTMVLRWAAVVLVPIIVWLIISALGPYGDYTAAQERTEALQEQRDHLVTEVEALENEADRLQDPEALEEQARGDLGLTARGEVPYIVTNLPTEDPEPVNASGAVPEVQGGENPAVTAWNRVVEWAGGLFN